MCKFVKMMAAAAAFTVAIATGSNAQDEPKKARPQGGEGRGGMMMGGGMGGGVYSLLATNKDLQTELKITDDQKKKLEDLSKAQREKMQEALKGAVGGRDATDEQKKEMREKFEKMQAESKKAYTEVLTSVQAARAQQISYQAMGIRAFADKDVQAGLKLTDEQKEKLKTVMEQYQKDAMELRGGRGGFGGGERPSAEDLKKMQDNMKKVQALGKEAEEKIATGLTDDQKKAWKEMIGEKFDVTKLQGGFGGRTRQDS